MNPHSQKKRKELGAYYTPDSLSQVLVNWAIRSPEDNILEPSFGGCGFLEASVKRLSQLGTTDPVSFLYGADVDKEAFKFLYEKLGELTNVGNRFLLRDFLKVTPCEFECKKFDAVLGNPPYISRHNMSKTQRASCSEISLNSEFLGDLVSRNASLWAYFLVHSLSFLNEGARAAWVLPSSLLHADYAKQVLKAYRCHFEKVTVVKVNQRLFQEFGADEIPVVILADMFSTSRSAETVVYYSVANNVNEFQKKLEDFELEMTEFGCKDYRYSLISKKVLDAYFDLAASQYTTCFSDIANVVIGMVTGDNGTFVIDEERANKLGLEDESVRPVVSKFSMLTGLVHTMEKQKVATDAGAKVILFSPNDISVRGTGTRKYLAGIGRSKRRNNKTFKKRRYWFSPDDKRYPDAFLSYMTDKGPRLVINLAGVNCTNSVHRVFFKDNFSLQEKKAIAASLMSSYSQLSAELLGRAYGSGVLKLEPSAAKAISLFLSERSISEIVNNLELIENLLIDGKYLEAQVIVDKAICNAEGIPFDDFALFSKSVNVLRADRYQGLDRKRS